jgi:subtilisin family serine protease
MSIGGRSSMPDVQDALKYALSKGCVVCIAAGNDGKYSVSFPAAYPEAISVGSSKDGKRSSFSNGGDRLDVSAPGENILSSVPGGKYAQMSGTSMATPYVAGEVALVMAEHPDWTPQQVQEQIKRGVNDLGAAGWDRDFGYGEVNLFKAVYGDNLPAVPRVPQKPKSFWQKLLAFFGLDV